MKKTNKQICYFKKIKKNSHIDVAEVGCSVLSIYIYFINWSFHFGENGMERAQPEETEKALGYELLVQ